MGETPVAVVSIRAPDGETPVAELRNCARERLASYELPIEVALVPELPRNTGGKVVKGELRKRFAGPAQ